MADLNLRPIRCLKSGATGLTVTVDIDRYDQQWIPRSAGDWWQRDGGPWRRLYHYRLASADRRCISMCTFLTADTGVDQQKLPRWGLLCLTRW